MSSPVAALPARAGSKSAVVGYIEALGEQGAIGWVWCPGHADRLRVELRLADQVLAAALADQSRDDLAQSGIGDGRHAFRLDVPEALCGRLSELRVLAHPIEGPALLLQPPPPASALEGDALAPLQRGIETLINSQRLLHRNLQAALLQQGPSPASALADIAAAQSKLNDTLATIELFVVRLETALQRQDAPLPAQSPRQWLIAAMVISGAAFVSSGYAVYRAIAGS